jgi:hypothetical protein
MDRKNIWCLSLQRVRRGENVGEAFLHPVLLVFETTCKCNVKKSEQKIDAYMSIS